MSLPQPDVEHNSFLLRSEWRDLHTYFQLQISCCRVRLHEGIPSSFKRSGVFLYDFGKLHLTEGWSWALRESEWRAGWGAAPASDTQSPPGVRATSDAEVYSPGASLPKKHLEEAEGGPLSSKQLATVERTPHRVLVTEGDVLDKMAVTHW